MLIWCLGRVFPEWEVCLLLREYVVGMRFADGDQSSQAKLGDERGRLFTSCARSRDELLQLLRRAGFAAYAILLQAAGTSVENEVTGTTITCNFDKWEITYGASSATFAADVVNRDTYGKYFQLSVQVELPSDCKPAPEHPPMLVVRTAHFRDKKHIVVKASRWSLLYPVDWDPNAAALAALSVSQSPALLDSTLHDNALFTHSTALADPFVMC